MRTLREPAFLTYRTEVPAGHTVLSVTQDATGKLLLQLATSTAPQPARAWAVAYRTSDSTASVALPGGARATSTSPIFDPTWGGAYRWLTSGLGPSTTPSAPATAAPVPAPSALPIIAVVAAIGPDAYRIVDAGAAQCPGNAPGHRMVLIARSDPRHHPLTGVVIDTRTLHFCAMTFHAMVGNDALGASLAITLHFGEIGGYDLITDGSIDGSGKILFISAMHLATRFRYAHVRFPPTLPGSLFTPTRPTPSPAPRPTPGRRPGMHHAGA